MRILDLEGVGVRTYAFGPDDPGRVRFAASALWEAVQAFRTLRDPAMQRYHSPWVSRLDVRDVQTRLPVLGELSPLHGYTPDFLTPPPHPRQRPDPVREIARVRRTGLATVATGLDAAVDRATGEARRAALRRLAADPAATLASVADELTLAWELLVAPWWPSVRALVEEDLAFRSTQIVREGLAAAVNDLHRGVRWNADRVEVSGGTGERALEGRGLLLMPSAFGWPRVITPDAPWPPTIVYPARGIGALWSAAAVPPQALGTLLGVHRARVLTALDAPATTTDLATLLDLAPASVSRHLGVLRDAGLVTARRSGRLVPYRRTTLGSAVVRGAGGA